MRRDGATNCLEKTEGALHAGTSGKDPIADASRITVTLQPVKRQARRVTPAKEPLNRERTGTVILAHRADGGTRAVETCHKTLKPENGNRARDLTPVVETMKPLREKKAFDVARAA